MLLYAVGSPTQAHGDSFQDGSERALNSPMFDASRPSISGRTQGLPLGNCVLSRRALKAEGAPVEFRPLVELQCKLGKALSKMGGATLAPSLIVFGV